MILSLLRHGIAEDPKGSDFDRRLTSKGRDEIVGIAARMSRSGWRPGTILHSPLVRTTETAALVSARFPEVPVLPDDEIAYGVLDRIVRICARHPDPLVVGHEPTMGFLCARLVGAPAGSMSFERGGLAILDVDRLPSTRPAHLLAFLSPRWVG